MKGRDTETSSGPPRTVRPVMAYRFSRPQIPGNKIRQKWDDARYNRHREMVMSAKPTINTTPSKMCSSYVTVHMGNIQLQKQFAVRMRRENEALKEKLALITKSRGRVDNWNNYEKKSLGEARRQREQLRIAKENEGILFRLSQCRSHYDRKGYQESWLKTIKVMDSIALYPRDRTIQKKVQENPVKNRDRDEEQKVSTHSREKQKAEDDAEEVEQDNVH